MKRLAPLRVRIEGIWRSRHAEAVELTVKNGTVFPVEINPELLSGSVWAAAATETSLEPGDSCRLVLVEMQLKDIFSASSDGVSQPSNSSLRFKQKALAATILATLAIIAFIAVEASDTKPARKAPTEAAMITLRPDGTDKDVLIARYDANFLALSRRIEEVQREAAATETRLRAIIADQKSRLADKRSQGPQGDRRTRGPYAPSGRNARGDRGPHQEPAQGKRRCGLHLEALLPVRLEDSRKGLSHRSRQKHERARLFNRPRASRHLGRREGSG